MPYYLWEKASKVVCAVRSIGALYHTLLSNYQCMLCVLDWKMTNYYLNKETSALAAWCCIIQLSSLK